MVMLLCFSGCGKNEKQPQVITNVSYDPTREFYEEYNALFENKYKDEHQEDIKVVQSHGGSGSQARSVVEGCNADVVTLALEHDITLIEKTGLIDEGWKEKLDKDSSPYTSTIVFVVRKGNPKQIRDWEDLVKDGIEVITPDPKSSGGACWNFMAALSYSKTVYQTEEEQNEFIARLYENVSVMDSGARGATTTFVENGKGDVLISWENEAFTIVHSYPEEYEIINPSVSILAQPSVAVVSDNVRANHTEQISQEYLEFLYSREAQRLAGKYGYRPSDPEVLEEYKDTFDLSIHRDMKNIPETWQLEHLLQTFPLS